MMERRLFEVAEDESEFRPESERGSKWVSGTPRLRVACRDQVVMRMLALDQMLPADDEARTVVAFVEQVDLSELYRRIRAVEGRPGQAPIDPKILLSLWLFATIKGVGSARELDRLCVRHLSYQGICGDVSVNCLVATTDDFSSENHLPRLTRNAACGVFRGTRCRTSA